MSQHLPTPAHRVEKGLLLAQAVLEAASSEVNAPIDTWRTDTLHGLISAALELIAETAKIAATLPAPILAASRQTDLTIALDPQTRRLLDLRAAGLGHTAEALAASMLRRGARSTWTERRRLA